MANPSNEFGEPNGSIDLNINPETVCLIINKAREFHAKEGVTFPETSTGSEVAYDPLQVLADHEDDLSFQEVEALIEDLEPDQQIELLALFYVGRGNFEATEWSDAVEEAKRNIAPRLTEYLFAKPQLSDHLQRALELLGYSCD